MAARRIVIVGAGIGGLMAAARLATAGHDITVLERAAGPGGKMRIGGPGRPMDLGPTVLTMRPVLDDMLGEIGTSLADLVTLRRADVLARHAWDGGGTLDLFAQRERNAQAIAAFAGNAEAAGYRRFCARAAEITRTLDTTFMRASRPNPISLAARVGLAQMPALLRISPFATLWSELGTYFRDPRLRQLFGRYATYCGSSPYEAPATLMLVAHVEQEGVWFVEGGMHRLACALADLATRRGATFHYGCSARRIRVERGRASGVETESGAWHPADAIVMNGAPDALAQGLLGGEPRRAATYTAPSKRSLSAMTFAFEAQTAGFDLTRHNVFFSADYAAEFDDILKGRRLPRAPTVYVCAQDRDDAGPAPSLRAERLFCLVNAPADGDGRSFTDTEVQSCQQASFDLLTRCGLTFTHPPQAMLRTMPTDFARDFPGTGGALYGQASHGWMASFTRPTSRTKIPGLYLAGGCTHPGPGVPMAALSGRQAALSVMTDLASRSTFHPVAMRGGMSMR